MKTLAALLLACTMTSAQANQQSGSSEMSDASGLVAAGSALVVFGSLSAVAASGTVVVESVEAAGDASLIVLAGASDAGRASIRLSGNAAHGASVVAGTTLSVVAIASGTMLVAAGKVIAFIPNEVGKALLHHSRAEARP